MEKKFEYYVYVSDRNASAFIKYFPSLYWSVVKSRNYFLNSTLPN
jgi:hypothetical protein